MHGTYPLLHRLERLALAKSYLALTRVMADSVFGNKSADHSLLLIGAAIMVGHAENRPLNATKIAHYVGLPRSTVIRKLNEFLRVGVIARHGNVYLCAKNRTKYVSEAMRIFRTAEKSLKASELGS
jgi:predicted transcriptional regulator